MNSLRFAEPPSLLRNALHHAEQMTIFRDFSCPAEKILQLLGFLQDDRTCRLLSRTDLMMLLEYHRIQEKNADRLASVMAERCTPMLSRILYRYWQSYYENTIVKSVCRKYIRKMKKLDELWQENWIRWLYFNHPPMTAARILTEDTDAEYEQLRRRFALTKDTLMEQRTEIFYYAFCSETQLKQITDENLSALTERLSPEEKHQFLNELFRRFPLILKDGSFTNPEMQRLYTVQYPATTEKLLESAEETHLTVLLKNNMTASRIPEEIHREYWGEYFLSFHENWRDYRYIFHPDKLEVNCADQYTILDFWEKDILFLFPVDLSAEILPLTPEQIQENYASSEEMHIIQGDHWRSKTDETVRQVILINFDQKG